MCGSEVQHTIPEPKGRGSGNVLGYDEGGNPMDGGAWGAEGWVIEGWESECWERGVGGGGIENTDGFVIVLSISLRSGERHSKHCDRQTALWSMMEGEVGPAKDSEK
jgi:hypothetical protein